MADGCYLVWHSSGVRIHASDPPEAYSQCTDNSEPAVSKLNIKYWPASKLFLLLACSMGWGWGSSTRTIMK